MTTTTYSGTTPTVRRNDGRLRGMLTAAAVFDGVMGAACLAAAGEFGRWLGVGTAATRVTGGVFLLAAAAGAFTLRRLLPDARLVAGANVLFAVWCLAMLGLDSPNALGIVLLAGAAATSAATAVLEHRLAR